MKTILKLNEKIHLETKQHIIVLLPSALISIVGIILGIILISKAPPVSYILFVIVIIYFLYKIIERKNNIWVVTNTRIIDEFGVFSLNSKESPLDKINNISYSQSLPGRIFNYGNIQIQTAAEAGITTYRKVKDPKLLKDTISRMHEDYKTFFISNTQSNISPSDEIEKLYNLMQKGIISKEEFEERKSKLLKT